LSIFIFFVYQKNIPSNYAKFFLLSKETAILVNNLFMMFFLSVVLIGTIYPIFLEVINNSRISIGPPFYQKLIIPFLIPFLLFMSVSQKFKWIKDKIENLNYKQLIFFIFSLIFSYFIIQKSGKNFLFSIPLFALSFFLFFSTIIDLKNKDSTISQKVSHLGFSLLIISILLNGIFSNEFSANMKVGDQRKFQDKVIKFENLSINDGINFKSLLAEFTIKDKKNIITLKPELRIYNQPKTITSEADIFTTLYSDNFLVFNILKEDEYYNVRYQFKPLMLWIWLSTLLISFGGIMSCLRKK
tara:strand:- start:1742 stop:2641 length:900 start_codon:yes stop_codon:yes gene_type:complete